MKVIQLIVAIFAIQLSCYAQTSLNFSVANAENLCGRTSIPKNNFSSSNGFVCLNNQVKLYYTLTPVQDYVLGNNTSTHLKYAIAQGVLSSYKIYGPFNQNDDYVTLIASNTAPVLNTESSITSYPKFISGSLLKDKKYIIEITANQCSGFIDIATHSGGFPCSNIVSCENCIPKFQPVSNQYIVSAWIKEANNITATTYTNGFVKVTSGSTVNSFYGSGQIIDGWQRIEGIVTTDNVGNLKIELKTNAGTVYFDDIRVFPTEGSMITYVYDPVTLRLVAELDERNYAKIYEYDEEGKLIRVKKETEKGVMTIQENRENTHGN